MLRIKSKVKKKTHSRHASTMHALAYAHNKKKRNNYFSFVD